MNLILMGWTGTGAELSDPFLRLRDDNGNSIAFNDDGGLGRDSQITYTATQSGTYYIEADAFSTSTGDYTLTAEEVPPSNPLDALEWSGGSFADGLVIDVYFALSGTTVADDGSTVTSDGFTAAEIEMIMGIYGDISNFADITFRRTFDQSSAYMQLARDDLGSTLLGYMYPQGSSTSDGVGVLTSNPTFWNSTTMQIGGGMYSTIVHELGHGLGLAHPHDNGGGSTRFDGVSGYSDTGDYGLNQSVFTIMSYNAGWNGQPVLAPDAPDATDGTGHASGFGAFDISVLQSYYGANTTFANDDDTYTLGVGNYYAAIWDTGGTDTIEMTGSSNTTIDLRTASLESAIGGGGYVSYTDGLAGGFTIADGSIIENAIGGSGDDNIQGNSAANRLSGGSGADTLHGGAGSDRLYSGAGSDRVYAGDGNDYVKVGGGLEEFYGGAGKDYISYYASTGGVNINLETNVVSGSLAGNDTIEGFESASGSKIGDDTIYGTTGSNTIKTYGGNDKVYAGKGTDKVYLGDGDDYVKVGGGLEKFYGGAGKDYISYYASTGGVNIDLEADTVSGSWAVNNTMRDFKSASGSKTGADKMYGTSGSNTLKSYGGDDKLKGRSGDDKLYGGSGADRFDGGAGTDLLYGGSGADVFHFDNTEDHEIIKDFENNVDTIELDNFTFGAGEDAFDFATQVGDDVVFNFGAGDMLTVEDATIGQLYNDLILV